MATKIEKLIKQESELYKRYITARELSFTFAHLENSEILSERLAYYNLVLKSDQLWLYVKAIQKEIWDAYRRQDEISDSLQALMDTLEAHGQILYMAL